MILKLKLGSCWSLKNAFIMVFIIYEKYNTVPAIMYCYFISYFDDFVYGNSTENNQ